MSSSSSPTALRTPKKDVAQFLGREWLTPDGKISKQGFADFLEFQIKMRQIPISNGAIQNTEYLSQLLRTTSPQIPLTELDNIFETLLHPVRKQRTPSIRSAH